MNRGFSIPLKLSLLVLIAMVFAIIIAVAGMRAIENTTDTTKKFTEYFILQGDASKVDMIHDAIRSDVTLAIMAFSGDLSLVSNDGPALFEEHATEIERLVKGLSRPGISGELKKLIETATPTVGQFVSMARSIVKAPDTEVIEARAKLPDFENLFKVLEKDFGRMSEVITATGGNYQLLSDED